MNRSPDNLLELWTKAWSMNRATISFAPKSLREQWNNLPKTLAFETLKKGGEAAAAKGITGMKVFETAFFQLNKESTERSKIERACEEHFFQSIKTGALRSFAFGVPRTVDSKPLELASEVWGGQLKWGSTTIIHQSITYVEVRVMTAKRAHALMEATLLEAELPVQMPQKQTYIVHKPPNRGRPTVKNEVEQAFRALQAANRINTELSSKSHYPLIREWLSNNAKDLSVRPATMSDETIRRITAPLFNALKDNQ